MSDAYLDYSLKGLRLFIAFQALQHLTSIVTIQLKGPNPNFWVVVYWPLLRLLAVTVGWGRVRGKHLQLLWIIERIVTVGVVRWTSILDLVPFPATLARSYAQAGVDVIAESVIYTLVEVMHFSIAIKLLALESITSVLFYRQLNNVLNTGFSPVKRTLFKSALRICMASVVHGFRLKRFAQAQAQAAAIAAARASTDSKAGAAICYKAGQEDWDLEEEEEEELADVQDDGTLYWQDSVVPVAAKRRSSVQQQQPLQPLVQTASMTAIRNAWDTSMNGTGGRSAKAAAAGEQLRTYVRARAPTRGPSNLSVCSGPRAPGAAAPGALATRPSVASSVGGAVPDAAPSQVPAAEAGACAGTAADAGQEAMAGVAMLLAMENQQLREQHRQQQLAVYKALGSDSSSLPLLPMAGPGVAAAGSARMRDEIHMALGLGASTEEWSESVAEESEEDSSSFGFGGSDSEEDGVSLAGSWADPGPNSSASSFLEACMPGGTDAPYSLQPDPSLDQASWALFSNASSDFDPGVAVGVASPGEGSLRHRRGFAQAQASHSGGAAISGSSPLPHQHRGATAPPGQLVEVSLVGRAEGDAEEESAVHAAAAALGLWPMPPAPTSLSASGAVVTAPQGAAAAAGGAAKTAPAAAAVARAWSTAPYVPVLRHTTLRVKIPNVEPSQLEGEGLAALSEALCAQENGSLRSPGANWRVRGVTVRAGCIDLELQLMAAGGEGAGTFEGQEQQQVLGGLQVEQLLSSLQRGLPPLPDTTCITLQLGQGEGQAGHAAAEAEWHAEGSYWVVMPRDCDSQAVTSTHEAGDATAVTAAAPPCKLALVDVQPPCAVLEQCKASQRNRRGNSRSGNSPDMLMVCVEVAVSQLTQCRGHAAAAAGGWPAAQLGPAPVPTASFKGQDVPVLHQAWHPVFRPAAAAGSHAQVYRLVMQLDVARLQASSAPGLLSIVLSRGHTTLARSGLLLWASHQTAAAAELLSLGLLSSPAAPALGSSLKEREELLLDLATFLEYASTPNEQEEGGLAAFHASALAQLGAEADMQELMQRTGMALLSHAMQAGWRAVTAELVAALTGPVLRLPPPPAGHPLAALLQPAAAAAVTRTASRRSKKMQHKQTPVAQVLAEAAAKLAALDVCEPAAPTAAAVAVPSAAAERAAAAAPTDGVAAPAAAVAVPPASSRRSSMQGALTAAVHALHCQPPSFSAYVHAAVQGAWAEEDADFWCWLGLHLHPLAKLWAVISIITSLGIGARELLTGVAYSWWAAAILAVMALPHVALLASRKGNSPTLTAHFTTSILCKNAMHTLCWALLPQPPSFFHACVRLRIDIAWDLCSAVIEQVGLLRSVVLQLLSLFVQWRLYAALGAPQPFLKSGAKAVAGAAAGLVLEALWRRAFLLHQQRKALAAFHHDASSAHASKPWKQGSIAALEQLAQASASTASSSAASVASTSSASCSTCTSASSCFSSAPPSPPYLGASAAGLQRRNRVATA